MTDTTPETDQIVTDKPNDELNQYPTAKEVFGAIKANKRFVMGTDIDRMFLISDAVNDLFRNQYGTDRTRLIYSLARHVEKLGLEEVMRRERIERLKNEVISTARGL